MKRHYKSAKCLTFVLTIILTVGTTSGDNFPCPGKYNCSCIPERYNEYELSCPERGEQQITIQLKPGSMAIFQCGLQTTSDYFNLLKDINIDAGNLLEFRLCPLPDADVPFTKLLQLNNASNIQKFTFRSHRAFNDTLKRRHFEGLPGITTLMLANNGFTILPPDLLEDMPRLKEIFLLNNQLQPPADLFQPVHHLEFLDLGKNDLTVLPEGLFRNLKKLQLLNLWKNKLSNLSPAMFRDLSNLTSLDLRHNGLKALPTDIFKFLTSLKNLSLNGNNFQTLPEGLFLYNKKLISVQVCDNRESTLTLPRNLFSNLPNLTRVDLHNSGLQDIPEDTFWGSTGITSISLHNNQLKELHPRLLQDAQELEKLSLHNNHISSLPDHLFKECGKMKFLDVSFNKITNLSMNVFRGLEHLEELYIQNNLLRHININTFQSTPNLKLINMGNNQLSFVGNDENIEDGWLLGRHSPLKDCRSLQQINLSNNSIDEIFIDWRLNLPKLNVLNLSHNALQYLEFPGYNFVHKVDVDVRHNKISNISINEASLDAFKIDPQENNVMTWLLEGNPLQCGCQNYDFFRYLEKRVAPEVLSVLDLRPGDLACAGPEEVANQLVSDIQSKAITCPLYCPQAAPCQCSFRMADKAVIVDCIGKKMTNAPAELPVDPSSNHTELYLTLNRLASMPDFSLPGYQQISKLALGYNRITSLKNITNLPKKMRRIELDHNNLTSVEPEALLILSNLTNLTLHNNPWKCECQHQSFASFVLLHPEKISKAKEMKCSDGRLLSELVSGLCSQTSSVVWASLVIALILGGFIGGMFAVYYKFTHEIKAWLFAHNLCLWFVTEEELDKDKLYDAFVSYSHRDEEFVVNELVPGLEGGPIPFKLCLHYRDWVAGEWIPNQITRSVEDSRRTLVVLSPNFLESVWGRLEFRAAHCQALSEGRARVIVVLYGDIGATEDLDPELRAYLNMNTYLKWGDPWFWNKLRYALPHPPKAITGSMSLVNHNNKLINGKSNEDKVELICEPNSPAPVTTPPAESNKADPLSKNFINGTLSSPRKVPASSHETNGIASAIA